MQMAVDPMDTQKIPENAGIGTWTLNRYTLYIQCDAATRKALGLAQQLESFPLKTFLECFSVSDRQLLQDSLTRNRGLGEDFCHQFWLSSANDKDHPVYFWGQVESDEHLSGFLQDARRFLSLEQKRIREISQAERQRSMESLGTLSGGFSHQFNNLLQVILLRTEEAEMDEALPESVHHHLQAIRSKCLEASRLCSQLQLVSGKHHHGQQSQNLHEILRALNPELTENCMDSCQFETRLEAENPFILAQAEQIQQVVFQLLANAREACPPGICSISLKTFNRPLSREDINTCVVHSLAEPGPFVCLEICDQGEGMSEEALERCTEPFFSTRFQGRGLGLAMVSGILQSVHGALKIQSSPNQGTCIQLYFPNISPPSDLTDACLHPRAGKTSEMDRCLILVIDDETPIRTSLCKSLRLHGYETLEAENGAQALNILETHQRQPAALILDLTMPVMNGEDFLAECRRRQLLIPTLIISGFSESTTTVSQLPVPPVAFLHKPFSMETLLKELQTLLGPKKQN